MIVGCYSAVLRFVYCRSWTLLSRLWFNGGTSVRSRKPMEGTILSSMFVLACIYYMHFSLSLQHEDASVLMFEHLLDQPLPVCSKTEEGGAVSSSQTLRQALREEKFRVDPSSDENDVVFIKELILGCPIGQQHQAKCDPTVSHSHYTKL